MNDNCQSTASEITKNFTGNIAFHSKRLREHILDFSRAKWKFLVISIATSLATAGALFGLMSLMSDHIPNWAPFAVVVATAVIVLLISIVRYVDLAPVGFENSSRTAKRLAQHRPRGWQCDLAKHLLSSANEIMTQKFEDIASGREFIPVTNYITTVSAYSNWTSGRIRSMYGMIGSAESLFYGDLLPAMFPQDGSDPSPNKMLAAVNKIVELQDRVIEFERDAIRAGLPDGSRKLYSLQFGWTEPVRVLFPQFVSQIDILVQRSRCLDPAVCTTTLSHTLTVSNPTIMEAWSAELDKVSVRPDLHGFIMA